MRSGAASHVIIMRVFAEHFAINGNAKLNRRSNSYITIHCDFGR